MPANKYSNDIFPVKILEPVALKDLQHEQGSSMEHGKIFNNRFRAFTSVFNDQLCRRYVFAARRTAGLMPKPKIRLQVNVAVAAEAEGGRVGEDFQVAVCTGVAEQAF